MIHPTAIISESAKLADDVRVGPYSIIGDNVEIGRGTRIDSHVVVNGPTTIGEDNHIYQFASIGDDPQDKKYAGERTVLEELLGRNLPDDEMRLFLASPGLNRLLTLLRLVLVGLLALVFLTGR